MKSLYARMSGWLQAVVRRIWWGIVKRDCWKCAHRLIMLGDQNGSAQEHIDTAKDALYRAVRAAEAEGSGKDSPNVQDQMTPKI